MFACTMTDRKTKLTKKDCTLLDIDPEHPHMGGGQQMLKPDGKKELKPHWHVFVDFEATPVEKLDCEKLMNGTDCEYST